MPANMKRTAVLRLLLPCGTRSAKKVRHPVRDSGSGTGSTQLSCGCIPSNLLSKPLRNLGAFKINTFIDSSLPTQLPDSHRKSSAVLSADQNTRGDHRKPYKQEHQPGWADKRQHYPYAERDQQQADSLAAHGFPAFRPFMFHYIDKAGNL